MQRLVRRLVWALALWCACGAAGAETHGAGNYTVGPGDKLNISILGRDGFSRITGVRGDGTIRLHLLGTLPVAGLTLPEIEERIVARAGELFDGAVSAVADIEQYRPVFVLGNVQAPGSYPYAPGMTVIKAIALAGGYERSNAETSSERAIQDAQRRAMEARTRLRFAEDEQQAIAAEIAWLETGAAPADGASPEQAELVRMGRAILDETVKGYEQRRELAEAEASLYEQRREIIARQLKITEEQLADITSLVKQGLSRRERLVDLQVGVDEFRSDELETTAYAARAEQTAANAESDASVAVTRYRRDLLEAKIQAGQKAEMLRTELNAAMDYLRTAAPQAALAVGEQLETVFEVYRSGADGAPEQVSLTSPLGPDDVLMVRFQGVTN